MVRQLYMYANAAWAIVTKSDLSKINRKNKIKLEDLHMTCQYGPS